MFASPNPEEQARVLIDGQLIAAGWVVQDREAIDLVNHVGVAVREVIMEKWAGRADYVLYVNRKMVGVIEAKPQGTTLMAVQWQSHRYSKGLTESQSKNAVLVNGELPFIYEASGSETNFTNVYDPEPRARHIFNFQKPETLARIIRESESHKHATWRGRVLELPDTEGYDLRPASRRAVIAIEQSLKNNQHSRSLVQMATGAGKTRMAVTESYRLLKHGGFNRVLFLVDRNNLGDQTLREFRDFTTPDDGRKFTDLYNVDKLTGSGMVDSSAVVISTIQRVFSVLKGQTVTENDDPNLDGFVPDAPVEVQYSPELPPESFDLVIVDECHRSIYGLWRGVIEYFDAHVVGLTATPTKQTMGFFQQNLVSEYTFPQSVVDKVNVDFEVYRIKTKISESGSTIEAGTVVPVLDKKTREQRLLQLDNEMQYSATDLDRSVVSKSQIRTVLETFRDRLFTEIFPDRRVVPKTLIFAKDDNHAEEIVTQVMQVFGKGNDFAAKITYNAKDPKKLLQDFRNSPTLRIAVTVDMIATGTDVKAIECVFFMRDVRSGTYFEQMKGRGARSMDDASFTSLTPDATHKERFVIVDAVGVTEHDFVDAAPLERTKTVPLKTLLEKAATFTITADETASLASRLARLSRELTPAENAELTELAGTPLQEITQQLVKIADPDTLADIIENAPLDSDGKKDTKKAMADFIEQIITPIASNPQLRQRILEIRLSHDLVFDEGSKDELLDARGVVDTSKAKSLVESWIQYIENNKNEITAIQMLYSKPKNVSITYKEIKELSERIRRPHPTWTVDVLWNAYLALEPTKVRKSAVHTTTDLVSLVRFTLKQMDELVPYAQLVEERYAGWLLQQENLGVKFTDSQKWWLDRIKDAISQSAHFDVKDLEMSPFTERGGTDGVLAELGHSVTDIINSMNMELAS
ncbi:HsdR Type I site-specific restriction-modification system, R (restriction) subunit and related helicases [Candidatus Nanopelagicaceae bacterium]